MPVIDVHTHMFTQKFMDLLKAKGGIYNLQTRPDGQVEISATTRRWRSRRRGISTTPCACATWTRRGSTWRSFR